jgi:hypothetical protein
VEIEARLDGGYFEGRRLELSGGEGGRQEKECGYSVYAVS